MTDILLYVLGFVLLVGGIVALVFLLDIPGLIKNPYDWWGLHR